MEHSEPFDDHAQRIALTYEVLFDRQARPEEVGHWRALMRDGLTYEEFFRAAVSSQEFRARLGSQEFGASFESVAVNDLEGVDLVIPIGSQELRVPGDDVYLVPHLVRQRSWEPHISSYLTNILGPTDVFVDAGANIGYYTVLCAPLARHVIAFEPAPTAFRYCELNVRLNGLCNVTLRREALWSEAADLRIDVDPSNLGASRIGKGETVAGVPLDDLDLRPTVVKIDVEGSEFSALQGMERTLASHHPVVLMELNRPALREKGSDASEVWRFLARLAYNISIISWHEVEPSPVSSLDELERKCSPESLVDLVATFDDH